MQSQATTVEQYLAALSADRRAALQAVRAVILKNLDADYAEGMQYGMFSYYVPHSIFPAGYHCDPRQPLMFAALASQKNYMSLYLMCVYGHEDNARWFHDAWAAAGKKVDMGKSCIRFKKLEDVPLEVVGEAIRRVPAKKYLAHYEELLQSRGKRPAAKAASRPAKSAKKKVAPKKSASKLARAGQR